MPSLKAVLFDLDDTLIDWAEAAPWEPMMLVRLERVLNYVRANLCPLPDCTTELLFDRFLNSMQTAWQEGVAQMRAPSTVKVLVNTLIELGVDPGEIDPDALMDVYGWQANAGVRAFPDVPMVLPEIQAHGVQLGVITNASVPMRMRDEELRAVGLIEMFCDCRFSAVDVGYLKPHALIFHHALNNLHIGPDEAVFVGDNLQTDIIGAQNVGMYGVLRVRDRETMETDPDITPNGIITSLHELLPLLDEWYPGWRENGRTP